MTTDHEILIRLDGNGAQGAHARYAEETSLGVMAGPAVPLDFSGAEFRRLVLLACERCDDAQIEALRAGLEAIQAARAEAVTDS